MRAFRNTILGETWMETGEAPDWQRLADRREAWSPGTVPERGLFLTAGADVQKDRIEVDVWAWGRGLESWLVDHLVLEGGPGDPACWQRLTELLGRDVDACLGSADGAGPARDRYGLRDERGLMPGRARWASRRWRR